MERDSKGRFKKKYNRKQELIKCSCGCENKLLYLDSSNRPRKFIRGHHSKINHPMKGRFHTEESKRKISKALIKRHFVPSTIFKKGNKPWNKGMKGEYKLGSPTKEHRKKISEQLKRIWKNPNYKKEGTIRNKNARAKQISPLKDTSIEIKIQNFLKQLGIEFFTHQHMNIKHGYQCDILIPNMNMVIECDGNYWHKYPMRRDIDNIRTFELLSKGFKVLRLWESEINNIDLNKFQDILKGGLNE